MSLSFVSLNAGGLRDNGKHKAVFLLAKQYKIDFFFLQITHSTANELNFGRSQWRNESWLSHGSEHSEGEDTLKNNFTGNMLHSDIVIIGH